MSRAQRTHNCVLDSFSLSRVPPEVIVSSSDFNGLVEEIMSDKGKVRVSVSLFGRPTSVELDYLQLRGY